MENSKIIAEYYENKELIAFFKKVAGEWWDELRQDVFVTLCEYDQQKVAEMKQRNQLKFFIVRVALNQFRSKTSRFYYQNFKNEALTDGIFSEDRRLDETDRADVIAFRNGLYETQDETEYEKIEAKIQQVENEIDGLRFFEREIFKIYLEMGTYKKVSLDTGIPIRTVANGVKNAISNINNSLNNKINNF